jgi:phospholipid/cholesterol/gamma-HCH transport system ATP-binding protein
MTKPPIIEFKNVTNIGKSGEGKSVLLKHIIGLLRPDEGSVLFRGRPIEKMSRREWDTYLAQISYMFQNNALFDSKTVYQNVAMPLRKFNQLSKSQVREKVMARLEQTELTNVVDKYPSELSGGMQKRMAFGPGAGYRSENRPV